MDRRSLVTGLVSFLAAPALVRADALMSLRGDVYRMWEYRGPLLPDIGARWEAAYKAGTSFSEYSKPWRSPSGNFYEGIWTFFGKDHNVYSDKQVCFRKVEIV